MKRSRIAGYSVLTLVVIAGIILAVLGALGYITPKRPSGGPMVITGGTTGSLNEVQVTDISPMWGNCLKGQPTTFDGVEYRLQSVCESPTCEVKVDATYVYPDGSTDMTSRLLGNSGWYHNPPTNPSKLPHSASIQVSSVSTSGTVPQGSYSISISPPSC